jgi:hypothetical protein
MNDFEIIQDLSQRSLIALMEECGMDASADTVRARDGRSLDVARRTFHVGSRLISYYIALDNETLGFMGEVKGARVSHDFVVNWNNLERIAPLIQLVLPPPSDAPDILVLKHSTNVRRSLAFATFRKIALSFEHAMMKLDRSAMGLVQGKRASD